MATVILQDIKKCADGCVPERSDRAPLERVLSFLPVGLACEIERLFGTYGRRIERIEEIRLRSGRRVYLTVGTREGKKNVMLESFVESGALGPILKQMCDGSLYSYSESIIKGYISLPSGVRVGVCGRAAVEGERVFGVYDISGLNIRIPRTYIRTDPSLLVLVRKNACKGFGTLIFSPPAQGKTTCLRSIAYELALGVEPMRVSVVDTRSEISFMPSNDRLSLDLLIGYPKAEGIRIATLFMNPEVIICDEIGSDEEARAIADAQKCGVPLIASAHGSTLVSLMRKKGIRELHRACVFGSYVSLRIGDNGNFKYNAYSWEEAQRICGDDRCVDDNL